MCKALASTSSGQVFVTHGKVVEVKRVQGSCYFTLTKGDHDCCVRCSIRTQQHRWTLGNSGQTVVVKGCATPVRDQYQLYEMSDESIVETVRRVAPADIDSPKHASI